MPLRVLLPGNGSARSAYRNSYRPVKNVRFANNLLDIQDIPPTFAAPKSSYLNLGVARKADDANTKNVKKWQKKSVAT